MAQRPAPVSTTLRTQVENLVCLRTVGKHDRKAIDEWVEAKGTQQERDRMMKDLAELPDGVGYFWSPGWLRKFQKEHFLRRETFDSGATPKIGAKPIVPKAFAEVDRNRLSAEIQATIERQKADDPKELRKRIVDLERASKTQAPATAAKADPDALKKEFDRGALSAKKALAREIARYQTAYEKLLSRFTVAFNAARERLDSTATELSGLEKPTIADLETLIADVQAGRVADPVRQLPAARPAAPQRQAVAQGVAADTNANGSGDSTVGNGGLRKILIALAQRPQGLSTGQIGTRANISSKSGSFDTYLSKGRSQGWLVGSRACLQITDEGIRALGTYSPLPEGPELLRHWVNHLGTGGAARMLQALADAYPGSLTAEELGIAANISSASGSFDTYLSKLRTLELITGTRKDLRASEELFS